MAKGRGDFSEILVNRKIISADQVEEARTLAACPEDSLADRYVRDLGFARTYVMDGDDLVLNLSADAGNMHFSPAP